MAQQAKAYIAIDGEARISSSSQCAAAKQQLLAFLEVGPVGVPTMTMQHRRQFAQELLNDLAAMKRRHNAIVQDDELRLLILKSLKELSRLPGGSNVQSEPTGLRTLLDQVELPADSATEASIASTSDGNGSSSPSSFFQRAWNRGSNSLRSSKAAERRSSKASSDYSPASEHPPSLPHPSVSASSLMTGSAASAKSQPPSPEGTSSSLDMTPHVVNWDVNDTALRCLNNALFLHETSRKNFAGDSIGGGRKAIALLRHATSLPADITFLACRLLFFATLFEASFNRTAVEEEGLIDLLKNCLTSLLVSLTSLQSHSPTPPSGPYPTGSVAQVKAALSEVLKVTFNIGLYYPRVATSETTEKSKLKQSSDGGRAAVGEGWNDKLGTLLEPVIQVLLALPSDSLTPPATNAIGVLLNFPVKPYKSAWLRSSADRAGSSHHSASTMAHAAAKRVATALFSSGSSASARTSSPSSSPRIPAHTALQGSTDSEASSSTPRGSLSGPNIPIVAHLSTLLSSFLARYFPPNAYSSHLDTDDASVTRLARADGVEIEDVGQPICLLLRKLVSEDDDIRRDLKSRLLPDDMDRTIAPDKRPDVTGRLIRLMSSASYSRLGRVCGELFLALCDDDAKQMVAEIGYGPCAGFLVAANIQNAFPDGGNGESAPADRAGASASAPSSASAKRSVNPITGQYDPTPEEFAREPDPLAEMTEEEKEAEAEKLFGLFDRLNRTGVVKVQHPVRDAGPAKIQEIDDKEEEARRAAEQREEKEEEDALRELAAYKSRKQGGAGMGGASRSSGVPPVQMQRVGKVARAGRD